MIDMMNELKISSTEFTPEVNFNAQSGQLSMNGRSMPENIAEFFDPISEWVGNYLKEAREHTKFEIYFDYYSSTTARRITEIIFDLELLAESGKKVNVVWKYAKGDLIMKENGNEIKSVVSIPFEIEEVV